MTQNEKKEAIKYIMAQLEDGYVDLGLHDENEIEVIHQAMNALGTIEQYKWERDVALSQLKEVGLSFGEKTDEIKSALNKQISMKPKEVNGLYNCTYYICPVCGNDGLSGNYCDKCGQRLDID